MISGFDKPKLLIINRPFFFFLSEGKTKFMKTIQEIDEERNENQQNDADELMQRMFSFIPLDGKHPTSAIISAKFCAKVACDYLYENLPNINETPPNSRNDERTYKQYWNGVKRKLEAFKAVAEKEEKASKP